MNPTATEEHPKVSVLVPVYNGERYLAECLDSILTQDFGDMEILVSDDHSSDGSMDIIEDYARRDARVRWWRNPQRVGLTPNSNLCLRAARGDYIKFVHQDDKLLSDSALRRFVAALDLHPTAVLAASEPHLTGTGSCAPVLFHTSRPRAGRGLILLCLEKNCNLIGSPTLTLFRKSCAARGFDERFTSHMDFEMWCHLLEQGDFACIPEPLATWRVHENQQTARAQASKTPDPEHLLFMETYYARSWIRETATARLRFAQAHYLRKKYGRSADRLVFKMTADFPTHLYAWQWLKHRTTKPIQNLSRKLNRLKRPGPPPAPHRPAKAGAVPPQVNGAGRRPEHAWKVPATFPENGGSD